MILVVTGLDRYVEPVFTTLIGALALLEGVFLVWLAVRRNSFRLAVRGFGGLILGAVFVLWGIGVTKDPFADPVFTPLPMLGVLLMVGGRLLGREPEERRHGPRRTPREVFQYVATLVVMFAALLGILWVVPGGYESAAILGAAIVFVVSSTQVRRWKTRRQARETEDAPGN